MAAGLQQEVHLAVLLMLYIICTHRYCMNDGSCSDDGNSCVCTSGFFGLHCQNNERDPNAARIARGNHLPPAAVAGIVIGGEISLIALIACTRSWQHYSPIGPCCNALKANLQRETTCQKHTCAGAVRVDASRSDSLNPLPTRSSIQCFRSMLLMNYQGVAEEMSNKLLAQYMRIIKCTQTAVGPAHARVPLFCSCNRVF